MDLFQRLQECSRIDIDENGKETASVHDFLDVLDTVPTLDSSQKQVPVLPVLLLQFSICPTCPTFPVSYLSYLSCLYRRQIKVKFNFLKFYATK